MLPMNMPAGLFGGGPGSNLPGPLGLLGGLPTRPSRSGVARLFPNQPPAPPQPWWKQLWQNIQPYLPLALSALVQNLQGGGASQEKNVEDEAFTVSITPRKKVSWEKEGSLPSPVVGAGIGAILGGLLSQVERPSVQQKLSKEQLTRHFIFNLLTGGLTGAGAGAVYDLARDLVGY